MASWPRFSRPSICGRPRARKIDAAARRSDCDHMSGLLMRSHMTAAKMGSAAQVPNTSATSNAAGWHGVPRAWDRSIAPSTILEQASASVGRRSPPFQARLIKVSRLYLPLRARCQQGARSVAPMKRSGAPLAGRSLVKRIEALAADHQLPHDPRSFVGQRYGRELWRLASDEVEQPGL